MNALLENAEDEVLLLQAGVVFQAVPLGEFVQLGDGHLLQLDDVHLAALDLFVLGMGLGV